jgi:dipeptidyl aminopeptidase/acylaminoacyl peptidase
MAAVVVVLLAAGGGAVAWRTRQEAIRLVNNPMDTRMLPTKRPIDFGMIYDEVSVTRPDGAKLAGWYVPTQNGAVIIAQHGYKAHRGEMLNESAALHRRGYGLLLPALRAHDMSDGSLVSFGKREIDDLEAWYRFVLAQPDVDPRRIGILGNSLGGTLSIQFAARQPGIAAVVAHSAFSSLRDTIDTSVRFFTGMPPFPFAPLIEFWAEREAGISVDDVDAKAWIARISPRPVFLMQGGADVVIDTGSGERLYAAAKDPKEFWYDPNVGHARFDTARADEYDRRVGQFFDSYLRQP